MKTALETVQNFQQWLGNGNDRWTTLFAEDISFKGPVDQISGKAAFIELNNNFMPLVEKYEPKTMFATEDKVVLEGIYSVNSPSGKIIDLETAEIFEVNNGLIQNIRIYYDAEEFRKAFAPAG